MPRERPSSCGRGKPTRRFKLIKTAKILLEGHRRASLHLNPMLRDRNMGSLQGKSWVDHPEQQGAGVESDEE